MKKEINIYDKIIHQHRYSIVRTFLEENKNDILKALKNKARYKEITNIDIRYEWFCKLLSDFRIKYIYNLTEAEYKKQMQAISQPATATPEKKVEIEQPEILAAKISESEQRPQPAQPKEPEKVETKKAVPADANPSGKIPKWKEAGFNSREEYFNNLQNQQKNIPEEKKSFVYETSILK